MIHKFYITIRHDVLFYGYMIACNIQPLCIPFIIIPLPCFYPPFPEPPLTTFIRSARSWRFSLRFLSCLWIWFEYRQHSIPRLRGLWPCSQSCPSPYSAYWLRSHCWFESGGCSLSIRSWTIRGLAQRSECSVCCRFCLTPCMSSRKFVSLVIVPDWDFKFVKWSSLRSSIKAMTAFLALPIFASEDSRRRELDYSHRHFLWTRLR